MLSPNNNYVVITDIPDVRFLSSKAFSNSFSCSIMFNTLFKYVTGTQEYLLNMCLIKEQIGTDMVASNFPEEQ